MKNLRCPLCRKVGKFLNSVEVNDYPSGTHQSLEFFCDNCNIWYHYNLSRNKITRMFENRVERRIK